MTGTPPKLSMLEMLLSAAASAATAKTDAERPARPSNPFPKGIREGSATDMILVALNQAHPRWLEHWELMQITGRSRGAIAWGMKYLAARGRVRSTPSAKHPLWFRYQAVTQAGADNDT